MDRRRLIPLILLLTLLAVVAVAYSVAIGLESNDIDQLGATSKVSVDCPVSGTPCKIDRVKWGLTTSAPYQVDKVQVLWTPASSSGNYTVYVELYKDDRLLTSGYATQNGSSSQVTTIVDVTDVYPEDVEGVKIVIVQN